MAPRNLNQRFQSTLIPVSMRFILSRNQVKGVDCSKKRQRSENFLFFKGVEGTKYGQLVINID